MALSRLTGNAQPTFSAIRATPVRNHATNRIEVIYAASKPTDEINSEAGIALSLLPYFAPAKV